MKVKGEAQARCGECGAVVYIPGDSLSLEPAWVDERQMGAELGYEATTAIECAHCGKELEVTYEASEYPIGVVDYAETTISGGELIKGFSENEIYYGNDIYSFDAETKLYLLEEKKIITNLESGTDLLIKAIAQDPELIRSIDPRRYEELIALIFSRKGFIVELTKQTRDGGRDIIAVRSDLGIPSKYIIECKRYSATNLISVDLVRNLYGVQMQEGANKSILATTSYFTPDAKKFASAKNTTEWAMALKDYDDIISWVKGSRT
ncbi:restriction endonuclease [Geomonas subterranea]|uniref:restriction endonuclease n=1 Tax=Geomonas subterranea TaxID=2847989 RepID=UPI001CD7382A|nr:restriction endonuclease [Geomonas fuzhouensis]